MTRRHATLQAGRGPHYRLAHPALFAVVFVLTVALLLTTGAAKMRAQSTRQGTLGGPPTLTRPDVTASIHQDIMDWGTRYRAKITVENRGNAPMPAVKVSTYAIPNLHTGTTPPSLQQCIADPRVDCIRHKTTVGPLAAGEKKRYHVGGKQLRTTTLFVQVAIECGLPGLGGPPRKVALSPTPRTTS